MIDIENNTTTPTPEVYLNTLKLCPNSPTGYCKFKGDLVNCIRVKTCIVPEQTTSTIEEKDT